MPVSSIVTLRGQQNFKRSARIAETFFAEGAAENAPYAQRAAVRNTVFGKNGAGILPHAGMDQRQNQYAEARDDIRPLFSPSGEPPLSARAMHRRSAVAAASAPALRSACSRQSSQSPRVFSGAVFSDSRQLFSASASRPIAAHRHPQSSKTSAEGAV